MNVETTRQVTREPHGSSDAPGVTDFSANTNPRVPPGTEAVFRRAFETARSYPEEPPAAFRATAADYVGCEPEQVIPTPGGLAAIRLVTALAVGPGDTALVPVPSFGEYAREVRLQGGTPSFVPHDRLTAVDPAGHALAVLCTPNNPTGELPDAAELDAFVERCRAAGTPLLVDEAFLGFTDRASLAGTEGVVVARALTKLFGLPGLRAGFAVATGRWREALERARRPWNVSGPALAVGAHCMEQTAFVEETRARVASERARLRDGLSERYAVAPSEAPFLLFETGDRPVAAVLEAARERDLVLRDATTFRGLDGHVRVAVREPEENDRLLEVLVDA